MTTVTIGIDTFDDEFKVPIKDDNITLEQFKISVENALGYKVNLNISKKKYDELKNKKIKDIDLFKYSQIFCVKNENIGNTIKHWTGNFKNIFNSCFRDSLTMSFIHSMAEKIVEIEDNKRKNNGYGPAKSFKEYKKPANNPDWNQLLDLYDQILGKIKNNDNNPMINSFNASNHPLSQSYEEGEKFLLDKIKDLADQSNPTSIGVLGRGVKRKN